MLTHFTVWLRQTRTVFNGNGRKLRLLATKARVDGVPYRWNIEIAQSNHPRAGWICCEEKVNLPARERDVSWRRFSRAKYCTAARTFHPVLSPPNRGYMSCRRTAVLVSAPLTSCFDTQVECYVDIKPKQSCVCSIPILLCSTQPHHCTKLHREEKPVCCSENEARRVHHTQQKTRRFPGRVGLRKRVTRTSDTARYPSHCPGKGLAQVAAYYLLRHGHSSCQGLACRKLLKPSRHTRRKILARIKVCTWLPTAELASGRT